MQKPWYASWTIRWNVVGLVLVAALMAPEVQAVWPESTHKYMVALFAVINIIQRLQTTTSIGTDQ